MPTASLPDRSHQSDVADVNATWKRSWQSTVMVMIDTNPRGAVACMRALQRLRPRVRVIAGVRSSRSARSSFLRYSTYAASTPVVRYDDTSERAFTASLEAIRRSHGAFLLLPSGERILRWAIANRRHLARHGVRVPTVDLDTYVRLSDKLSFAHTVRNYDIEVPAVDTGLPSSWCSPFVAKPIRPRWCDANVLERPYLVHDAAGFDRLQALALDPTAHFHQQYVSGPSYYYCALYWRGRLVSHFFQKTLLQAPQGGPVVAAAPALPPSHLTTRVDAMMGDLAWDGIMMMEFKRSGESFYAIECNPRVWGPLQLSLDNGVDFIGDLVTTALQIDDAGRLEGRGAAPSGYVWASGIAEAALIRARTGSPVQRWPHDDDQRPRALDVWFRRDTWPYALLEPVMLAGRVLRSVYESIRRRASHGRGAM